MNPIETGKAIATLRKEAGFTQATLAEALDISDKAISKWERGVACPDISLLPRLSILLDTDIESIIRGKIDSHKSRWKGILVLDDFATTQIYSKPLVYFLLSYFLLVGIKEILICGGNVKEILGDGQCWGLSLSYNSTVPIKADADLMVVYGNVLIYGAHLTRRFQGIMAECKNVVRLTDSGGSSVPVLFCRKNEWNPEIIRRRSDEKKRLARGITCIKITNLEEAFNAADFVRIIENVCGGQIADLDELSSGRGLI